MLPARACRNYERRRHSNWNVTIPFVYDPDAELLVTHGGVHAYYVAMQSILNPGDDVLIPDPTWATHANMVIMLRGNVIRVPASGGKRFSANI